MYPWVLLEPEEDKYDFTMIQEDLDYLAKHGKTLFIQLQDATFDPSFRGVPDYLDDVKYGGGSVPRMNEHGKQDGWITGRWDSANEKSPVNLRIVCDVYIRSDCSPP